MTTGLPQTVPSPFMGTAKLIQVLPVSTIEEMYCAKCALNILPWFGQLEKIGLYECEYTGYKFWRPEHVAGDEDFYKKLNLTWPNYYRSKR